MLSCIAAVDRHLCIHGGVYSDIGLVWIGVVNPRKELVLSLLLYPGKRKLIHFLRDLVIAADLRKIIFVSFEMTAETEWGTKYRQRNKGACMVMMVSQNVRKKRPFAVVSFAIIK